MLDCATGMKKWILSFIFLKRLTWHLIPTVIQEKISMQRNENTKERGQLQELIMRLEAELREQNRQMEAVSGADVVCVMFIEADVGGAMLIEADICGAMFIEADIGGAMRSDVIC